MTKGIEGAGFGLPPEHDIRVASDFQMKPVADILASAFTHDPVINWVCDHPEIFSTLFRLEVEALYKQHHHVYINSEQSGAAMWLPTGVATAMPFHWRSLCVLWKFLSRGGFASLKRADRLQEMFAKWHIQEPHFYLHAIGASLENQGRGIGSALLKKGLSACDQVGVPAYLESTNEKNNPLYGRFGFEIIAEESLPEGGPTVWFMKREKRASR